MKRKIFVSKNERVDKFVLSKGHASSCYYAVLTSKGYIPHEDLKTFRKGKLLKDVCSIADDYYN